MKIRKGFISNSSSSSFLFKVYETPVSLATVLQDFPVNREKFTDQEADEIAIWVWSVLNNCTGNDYESETLSFRVTENDVLDGYIWYSDELKTAIKKFFKDNDSIFMEVTLSDHDPGKYLSYDLAYRLASEASLTDGIFLDKTKVLELNEH